MTQRNILIIKQTTQKGRDNSDARVTKKNDKWQ